MTDCAETRALVAVLAHLDDRARNEIRSLAGWERTALATASRRLARLCEEPFPDENVDDR